MSVKPRRCPLLGTEDPNFIKQKRAFTSQSEQEIWDIGTGKSKRLIQPLCESKFGKGMSEGKYPFQLDQSGYASELRLAWLTELQNLDYVLLLPDLIDGLTDKHTTYANIATVALVDLIKHGPLEKLIEALPVFSLAIRNALNMNNVHIARRVLVILKRLTTIQPDIGPDLSFYLRDILSHLNYYMESNKDMNDQIVYNPNLSNDLYDSIVEVIQLCLRISASELDTAEKNIKLAIPTYQINREALL